MSNHQQPVISILLVLFLSLLTSPPIAARVSSPTLTVELATDKAYYAPGEPVVLTATGTVPDRTMVRYCHGTTVVASHPFAAKAIGNTWTWQPPTDDFKGYLVELYINDGDQKTILGTIAVDVSSDWTRFPRYGFVADFEEYGNAEQKTANICKEMAYLNRCHINGVQFQDWQWKHHRPVCLNADGTMAGWYQDISNRWVGTTHIKKYIEVQHSYGMKSIFYNLCFGAWSGASADGVEEAWNLYAQDQTGNRYQDFHGLPSTWQSNIYLEDPGNGAWQQYMADRNEEVYSHFDFDGYQIDQLGYRGTRYDAAGNVADLPAGYASFIRAMKARHPEKRLVMNAVSGYGAEQIAGTGKVDFCYNEVWGNGNGYGGVPEDQFANLYAIIRDNDRFSDHNLRTVFAAYMNYDKADNGGSGDKMMNTPGVLLTDAVMFALGGSHLELGDHMLSREYFPAAPLAMTNELKTAMIRYYDFMTAYQNWLREKSSKFDFTANATTSQAGIQITAWPPKADAVVTFAKKVGLSDVIHFLNFRGTDDLSWRDLNGTRQTPPLTQNLPVTVDVATKIGKLWVASPDIDGGAPRELPFTQADGKVTFTLPSLLYWTMVVMEPEPIADRLLIVGPAVWGNWTIANSTVMSNSTDAPDVFKVTAHLNGLQEFKFLTTTDWGGLEYRAGDTSVTLQPDVTGILVSSDETSSDNKFSVPESANYDIVCDLQQKTVIVSKSAYQTNNIDRTGLWLVGSATPGGWTILNGLPLTQDSSDPLKFSGTADLVAGEFKIAINNQTNYEQTFYQRDATDTGKMVFGGDDNKWEITEPGTYRVSVDVLAMTITVQRVVNVTIGDTGYATYCSEQALDFSSMADLKAYVVSGVSGTGDVLQLMTQQVTDTAPATGLLLHGAPGSYTLPVGGSSTTYENKLFGVIADTELTATDGDYKHFLLANGTQGIGFYPVSITGTLAAHKAYLSLPATTVASAKALFFNFTGEATGVMTLSADTVDAGAYYTLSGCRVEHPTKGVYIHHGKKIIVK